MDIIMKKYIDFNADLGESYGLWKCGDDDMLFEYITSANVACGFHAGDPSVMDKTIRKAKEKGVAVGCHCGLPDLEGFGRRLMKLTCEQAANYVTYQLGALDAFLKKYGMKMQHVKPHGAFYLMTSQDEAMAGAIIDAIRTYDDELMLLWPDNSSFLYQIAKDAGMRCSDEFYIDRGILDDGKIVFDYRFEDIGGSYDAAADRLLQVLKKGEAISATGKIVEKSPASFCVHSDTPNAVNLVRAVVDQLKRNDYELKAIGQWYQI